MLLESRASILLVVDIQEKLMPAMAEPQRVIANAAILMGAAYRLGIPVIATEQYPKGLGPMVPQIAGLMRDRDAVMPKMTFSAANDGPTMARLRQSRRSQVVLAGVEAHVCVLQTAIGLSQAGYQVFVIGDAITSRSPHNVALALQRLNLNGISVLSLEMALFEWLGRAGTDEFRELSRLIK